jgi:putative heme-binding domain-containing protein
MTRNIPLASRSPILAALVVLAAAPAARAADPPADSPMVKLLKSGRVPEERQGTILKMLGERGTVADLDYIYQRAFDPKVSFAVRAKSLDALADAATTRNLRPEKDRDRLAGLLADSLQPAAEALRQPACHLAGAWKLAAACPQLRDMARSARPGEKNEAIAALAAIGGTEGRAAIDGLCRPGSPPGVRLAAIAALIRLDADAAAARATELIPEAAASGIDLTPLIEGFLNHKGGGAILAKALAQHPIPPDAAKLALRASYALSQSDAALLDVLGKAAGIATEVKPMASAELSAMVAEVAAKGDPVRGESVFRRKDLNCLTCHAVAKAGGDIGPDLSAVGQTSPPDYIINSILLPDQSIKEQYHTLVVQTVEGQVYQGIVADRDDRRVVLKESTGAVRTVAADSIEEQKEGGSLMPKGLVNLMTHVEFVDLVRFLSELGKPGPYAIRTTPTIQRWRVLKADSAGIAEPGPEDEALPDAVLHAPADRWATVYARVSGTLALHEAAAAAGGGKVFYVRGDVDVTAAGAIQVSPRDPVGIRFWVDNLAAPLGTGEFTTNVTPGRHAITVRVDRETRKKPELRIEVDRPANSLAEFTVVGGK